MLRVSPSNTIEVTIYGPLWQPTSPPTTVDTERASQARRNAWRQYAAYRPAEQEFHTFKPTCTAAVPNWSNPPGGLRTFGAKTAS